MTLPNAHIQRPFPPGVFLNIHQKIDPFRFLGDLLFLARRVPLLTFDNREQHIFRIIFSQRVQPDRTAPALAAERGIFTGLDFITGLLQQLQVHALRVMQNALAGGNGLIGQDLAHHVGEGNGELIRLGISQADCLATLRVPVNQQHLFTGLGQPDTEIGAGGCFADTALLVGNGDNLGVHNFTPQYRLVIYVLLELCLEIRKAATNQSGGNPSKSNIVLF